ncbi:MAG: formylmethanofuran dehydrogenase subunit B [Peptococcaceae bacterium]|nr:formylmethanofuran dehydrogenase subunit B [Peptococcaceae bacterium]
MSLHQDVVCAFCGSLCDDLEVEVENNEIKKVKNVCAIGRNKIMHQQPHNMAPLRVNGKECSLDDAYNEAARILTEAKAPIIYGLSSTTAEANSEAVELAELLNAAIDNPSSYCHGPGVLARQHVGMSTCTLGEVKNRADLIVIWGANPMESHPRHFNQYSVMAKGMYVPDGRKGRKVVAIDVRPTMSSKNADIFLQITPGSDFEIINVLRSLAKNLKLEGLTDESLVGGVPLANWRELVEMMKASHYGVVLFGIGLTQSRGKDLNIEHILSLVDELNRYTRFYAIPMRGHANVNGSNQVLVWRTGFPLAVNFYRGYPRFNPGEFSVFDMLIRKEVDAAVIIATDPAAHLPQAAVKYLQSIPTILIDPIENLVTPWANVVIPVAPAGIGTEGTYYRMDNVPLRLKKIIDFPCPSDYEVLHAIKERVSHVKNS